MDIQIRADNYRISEYVDQHAKNGAKKLQKRFGHITNCEFILSETGHSHHCELIVLVPGHTLSASADHELMPAAIDATLPKMEKQLERYKSQFTR